MFEDRQRKDGTSKAPSYLRLQLADCIQTGKPISHQFAKELLVGFAGAEVDRLAETKGMDFVDREKAKRHAKENAENMYDEHYVRDQGADQYDP